MAAAVVELRTAPVPFAGHIMAAVFDEVITPRWRDLLASAGRYPTVTACAHCASERVEWDRDEAAYYCPDCRTVGDTYERNDLAEALEIASSHPVYGNAPEMERRHLLALVSHCLWMLKEGGRA